MLIQGEYVFILQKQHILKLISYVILNIDILDHLFYVTFSE